MILSIKIKNLPRWVTLAALLILLPILSAMAHHPLFEDRDTESLKNSIEIPRPETSYAVYGGLDSPSDVDFIKFTAPGPMKITIGIIVPFLPEYRDFCPAFALVGKGLPENHALPVKLPREYGALAVESAIGPERQVFHEHFSNTRYFRGPEYINVELNSAGDYYILVWHPRGEKGSYVISFGKAEKWRLREIPQMIKDLKRIKSGDWIIKRYPPESKN